MPFKLALANLKGGVGKSTSTVFIAEALACQAGLRVLIVDLDPQANASYMLLSREGVETAEASGKTLPHLLLDIASRRQVQAASYIWPLASDIIELQDGKAGRVDILASIPRMWFVEMAEERRYYLANLDPARELHKILINRLAPLEGWYDLIIFDCPPGFSSLTRAGLLSADAIISPTIADAVSIRSLADFVEIGLRDILRMTGPIRHHVIISKFRSQSNDGIEADRLKMRHDVLEPYIRYTVDMTRATERLNLASRRNFRKKYEGLTADIVALSDKIYRKIIRG